MKVNELRIGNYVDYGGICELTAIGSNCWVEYLEHEQDRSATTDADVESLSPIPLNYEWLKRFGAKDGYDYSQWFETKTGYIDIVNVPHGTFAILGDTPELSSEPEQRITIGKINYVHELQNLYFAITGEELKYTP